MGIVLCTATCERAGKLHDLHNRDVNHSVQQLVNVNGLEDHEKLRHERDFDGLHTCITGALTTSSKNDWGIAMVRRTVWTTENACAPRQGC